MPQNFLPVLTVQGVRCTLFAHLQLGCRLGSANSKRVGDLGGMHFVSNGGNKKTACPKPTTDLTRPGLYIPRLEAHEPVMASGPQSGETSQALGVGEG